MRLLIARAALFCPLAFGQTLTALNPRRTPIVVIAGTDSDGDTG